MLNARLRLWMSICLGRNAASRWTSSRRARISAPGASAACASQQRPWRLFLLAPVTGQTAARASPTRPDPTQPNPGAGWPGRRAGGPHCLPARAQSAHASHGACCTLPGERTARGRGPPLSADWLQVGPGWKGLLGLVAARHLAGYGYDKVSVCALSAPGERRAQ